MKNLALIPAATAVAIALLASSAPQSFAQGAPQTISVVEVKALANGFRASKLLGATVVNEANETVGKVDDIIVSQDGHSLYAVISVGGFLGLGDHLVLVPYGRLKVTSKEVELAGASKEQLKSMAEFKYATK